MTYGAQLKLLVCECEKFESAEEFVTEKFKKAIRDPKLRSKIIKVCGKLFWKRVSDSQLDKKSIFRVSSEDEVHTLQELHKFCLKIKDDRMPADQL